MRSSLLVGLALLLGALTALIAAQWVGSGTSSAKAPVVQLVVAAAPIEAGAVLEPAQLKTMVWAGAALPAQSLQDPQRLVGRVTRYPMTTGELVLEGKLAPVDARAGLSAVITKGKRAISVRVNEVIGVAGFALPGSYVDVLVSGKDQAQQAFSKMVISRTKVLAVAQDTTADPNKPKVTNAVTLELTPAEAERLDLARSIGTLSLILRNEADQTPWTSSGARITDLLSGQTSDKSSVHARTDKPSKPVARAVTTSSRGLTAIKPVHPVPLPVLQQEIRGLELDEMRR